MGLELSKIDAELDALAVSEVAKARAISLALAFRRPASLDEIDAMLSALQKGGAEGGAEGGGAGEAGSATQSAKAPKASSGVLNAEATEEALASPQKDAQKDTQDAASSDAGLEAPGLDTQGLEEAEAGASALTRDAIAPAEPAAEPSVAAAEEGQPSELTEKLSEALFDDLGLDEEIAALTDAFGEGDSPFSAERVVEASETESHNEDDEVYTSYDRPSAIELDDEEIEIMELDDLEIIEDDELEPGE